MESIYETSFGGYEGLRLRRLERSAESSGRCADDLNRCRVGGIFAGAPPDRVSEDLCSSHQRIAQPFLSESLSLAPRRLTDGIAAHGTQASTIQPIHRGHPPARASGKQGDEGDGQERDLRG